MRATPAGNSIGGVAGTALRTAEGTGLSVIKTGAIPVMSDVGADLQGGNISAGQVFNDGLESAVADARHLSKLGALRRWTNLTNNKAQAKAHNRSLGTGDCGHNLTPYQRIGQIDGLSDDQTNQM